MIVYGDHAMEIETAAKLDQAASLLAAAERPAPWLERHAILVDALIAAGELAQGVADAEFQEQERDDDTPARRASMVLTVALAQSVAASWSGDPLLSLHRERGIARAMQAVSLPRTMLCRQAEGYAYYAVYPELFLEAAAAALRGFGPILIVGLRSIGTSLAAMVAAAIGPAQSAYTLRPLGDLFDRRIAMSPRLAERLHGLGASHAVVVDEGPGLSGSSFAATGDRLEQLGVPASNIIFMPSHRNGPGPRAKPGHRCRWAQTRIVHQEFDCGFLTTPVEEHRLESWVGDLIGPILAPLEDVSAGRWRGRRPAAPALPRREKRKFIAVTESGTFLLKFAGLGGDGHAKAARARALHAAGFTPFIVGFRHGFLVEQWRDEAPIDDPDRLDRERLVDTLARYIAFRAEHLPADGNGGASPADLLRMARANAEEAVGPEPAARIGQRIKAAADAVARSHAVHVDGRMHAWEWLQTAAGPLIKTDAIDHSCQHDLVGCQDPAWDIAAARIEFALSEREFVLLLRRIARLLDGLPDPHLLCLFSACYPAFQLGLWLGDGAQDPDDARLIDAHVGRYRDALLELAQ
jgi:hypothetical protein